MRTRQRPANVLSLTMRVPGLGRSVNSAGFRSLEGRRPQIYSQGASAVLVSGRVGRRGYTGLLKGGGRIFPGVRFAFVGAEPGKSQ